MSGGGGWGEGGASKQCYMLNVQTVEPDCLNLNPGSDSYKPCLNFPLCKRTNQNNAGLIGSVRGLNSLTSVDRPRTLHRT